MSAHILIVDDNPTNLKLATDVLQACGFGVSQAVDAEHAEMVLRTLLPDLILMDIALPGMDGLTLTRKLRSDSRYAELPIVALTAFAMKGDDDRARAAGCDGHISKPIDTRRLPGQIAQFLQTRARVAQEP